MGPILMGREQREIQQEDLFRIRQMGVTVANTGNGIDFQHPTTGATASVTRSLGDRQWKTLQNGSIGNSLVLGTPEVQSLALAGHERHPFLILVGSSVASVLDAPKLVTLARSFSMQPR